MPLYDLTTPQQLLEIQQWFAEIITQPLVGDDQIYPFSPRGNPIQQEACQYITPSPFLDSFQRIEIYNQQYWWRLLKHLQEMYPLLHAVVGPHEFQKQIGVPFLQAYPPSSWSLNAIGTCLPQWIEKNYHRNDKELLENIAKIEEATTRAFYSKKYAAPDLENPSLFQLSLKLQPHLHLLALPYDLFTFKKEILKEELTYWQKNQFPLLAKDDPVYYFIVYQNLEHHATWKRIPYITYQLLPFFKEERTIEQLCEWLENQEASFQNLAAENFMPFIQECLAKHWLYTPIRPQL